MKLPETAKNRLEDALKQLNLRPTQQREHVFAVLLSERDHPTADEVYVRAKKSMPSISLATVYNCLEILVSCKLVKQVNFDREPTRYCPNLAEHAHFHCNDSHRVYDVDLPQDLLNSLKSVLPKGYEASKVELSFHGTRVDTTPSK
ncbi:MAG TPA: transcriptional repressor [Opitutae bacterium]|nr:transcriptional repressor [Opitutae bacterium]|tara:strand:- start:424 stop:861 length:438 start_codon:yes stop_codon:yes gene_type:complete